ncbi:unnamed protein product, partial [Callosobruchus maculatus]
KSGRSLHTHTLITRCLCGLNANWFLSREWIITKSNGYQHTKHRISCVLATVVHIVSRFLFS